MENVNEVTLTKIRVAMQKVIDERLLMDASFEIAPFLEGEYRTSLRGYLLGEDIQREEVSCPADWWQAFKDRWFPDWAKCRWPIKRVVTVLDAKALYTQFRPLLTNEPYRIDVAKWSYND